MTTPSPHAGEQSISPAPAALLPNNLDLLRLAAAAQVLIVHTDAVFLNRQNFWVSLLAQAPGVPIFFFISGLLISAAWERHPEPRIFAVNRVLRLAPAYLAVSVFSLIAILAFAHLPLAQDGYKLALWFAAQLVLLSDWNPQFLRHYGDGVVNGSLWTIPIEVCFYVSIPFLYRLIRGSRHELRLLLTLTALSFACVYSDAFLLHHGRAAAMAFKFIALTPFPWFGMFLCGVLAQRNLPALLPIVRGRAWLFGLIALAVMVLSTQARLPPLLASGNRFVGVVNFFTLGTFALAFAFSQRSLAGRLLRRNDISYGLYLFHLPIANILLANGVRGATGMFLTWALALAAACLSWFALEKPALALRAKALYRHD